MAKIRYEQNILEKESLQKMETINDEVHLAKERSRADAEFYKIQKLAEANRLLLTKEYLDLKKIEAMSVNNKVRTRLLSSPSIITKISIYFLRFILAQTFQICSSVKRTLSRTLRGRQRIYYPQLFYLWFIKHFSGWLWLKRAYNVGSLRDAWLMIEICILFSISLHEKVLFIKQRKYSSRDSV